MLDLSRAERRIRARPYLQPEISLLRGQCLERQSLFVDAAQTYHFIIARYPTSEYAYRAKARLETASAGPAERDAGLGQRRADPPVGGRETGRAFRLTVGRMGPRSIR